MPGVCILGDKARVIGDAHGCPGCPHVCLGPAVTGSPDVFVNGVPAVRLGDVGIHAACCGPNVWEVIEASGKVFVNGQPLTRAGDKTMHCGVTQGEMIEGSGDVNDNSPRRGLIKRALLALQDAAENFADQDFLDQLELVSPYLDLAREASAKQLDDIAKTLDREARVPRRYNGKKPKNKRRLKQWRQAKARFEKQRQIEKAARLAKAGKYAKAARILGKIGTPLTFAAGGLHSFNQWRHSSNATRGGRAAHGLGAGGLNIAFAFAAPPVALADGVTGGHIGKNFDGAAHSITSFGEMVVTGNTKGAAAFHEQSKGGKYGPVFKAASEAGDYWAEYGVVQGVKNIWEW